MGLITVEPLNHAEVEVLEYHPPPHSPGLSVNNNCQTYKSADTPTTSLNVRGRSAKVVANENIYSIETVQKLLILG